MTRRDERERCAAIADLLVLAIKMGAGTANSAEFRRGCISAAEWIRDEIKRAPRADREYDPDVAPCDDAEFGMGP